MDFPQLLTEAEAAEWLGVPIETVAMWARDGKLLAAARTEGGQLLFYRWRVEHDGTALAAFAPIRTAKGRSNRTPSIAAHELVCGCRLSPRARPLVPHRCGVASDGSTCGRFRDLGERRQASGSHSVAVPRCAVAAPDRSTTEAAGSSSPGGSCGRSRSLGGPRSGPPHHTGE